MTQLLADLVSIPSVNPMGRPVEGPIYFEGRLTEFLIDHLSGLGVEVTTQEAAPGRRNVLARYESARPSRTILFDVHQDTVPVDGMVIEPFRPAIEGGRLSGRGSCDVKAGMAAMLVAFRRLVRDRPAGAASVVLACTVDEEFTHVGSAHLARSGPGADLAIVAEPTSLDVVHTHKGSVRWRIRARGVACHSSTPERGDNAIYRIARVVDALRDHARALAASSPDATLGPPSLSVGRIAGGQSVNVIPDWAEIEIDRRLIPGEDSERARAAAHGAIVERLGDADSLDFEPAFATMPALASSGSAGWVGPVSEVIASVLGRPSTARGVPYGTDAGPLAQAGIPSLVVGPGDIAQAHTSDEWVDLEQVRAAVEVYYEIARSLG